MSSRSVAHSPSGAGRNDAEEGFEFRRMPGHLIRRMHQASMAIFDAEITCAGFDLTAVQFAALTVIRAEPGLDQATLAGLIAYDRVTIGGVIDRLESKGYVRREIAKGDRRSRRLYLEPAGEGVIAGVTPIVRRIQGQILQGLDRDEQAQLVALLRKALGAVGDLSRASLRDAAAR